MKLISHVDFKPGSREEQLPDFDPAFPLISTCYPLMRGGGAPWHWHSSVELFYIEEGTLEYMTPSARQIFPPGSGGLINVNVLHSSRCVQTLPQQGRHF